MKKTNNDKKEERARQKRLTGIEGAIEKAESELQVLEEKLADPAMISDYEALARHGAEHAALQAELEKLYGEWEEVQG